MNRPAALIIAVSSLGCRGVETPAPATASTPFVISTPRPDSALAKLGQSRGDIAWVALPAGTIPNADAVSIRVGSSNQTVTAAMSDGGLDPVPVFAVMGDELQLTMTTAGANLAAYDIAIHGSKGPVVIRTSPAPKKRDVPLNATIVIVFSEPLSPVSITPGAVTLTSAAASVAGRLSFADSTHLALVFTPIAPLTPGTDYTLTVTQEVKNVDGQPLGEPMVVPFTTTDRVSALQKYELAGTLTDEAGTPLTHAALYFTYVQSYAAATPCCQIQVQSDGAGRFVADISAIPGGLSGPPGTSDAMAFLDFVSAGPDYDSDSRYVLASAVSNLGIHLTRRREIAAGDSMNVVVSAGNSICSNNVQDMHPWPTEWLCAVIHVLPSSDGQLTITARPMDGAALPGLEAEAEDWSSLNYSIYPPTGTLTFPVSRGMPQRVMVEIPFGSPRSMSFIVKTTLTPQ